MSQIQERIAQFRKMANDDPDNELGHYRLGQLLAVHKRLRQHEHERHRAHTQIIGLWSGSGLAPGFGLPV